MEQRNIILKEGIEDINLLKRVDRLETNPPISAIQKRLAQVTTGKQWQHAPFTEMSVRAVSLACIY